MTIVRVRFLDATTNTVLADMIPTQLSASWRLSQSADWNASFPQSRSELNLISQGNLIEVYLDSTLIFEGIVQNINRKWSGKEFSFDLSGRSNLDRLYDVRAYSQAYYENKAILIVLTSLLRRAGWRIGNIETMVDKTQVTSVDLRQEKRLLAQVQTLLSGIPRLFHRYGGYIAGKYALDIGEFGSTSDVEFYKIGDVEYLSLLAEKTGAILDVNRSVSLTDIVKFVEVIGGDVKDNAGVTRTISLKDALAANPALATDPNFPIITDVANYVYHIINNALSSGSESTERYTQYAPPKETGNATLAAVNAAGLALYNRGVSFLLDHQENIETISLTAIGDYIYVSVGDSVYVKVEQKIPIFDPFTDEVMDYVQLSLDGSYRTTSVNLNFDGKKISWQFEVSDAPIVKQEDLIISLYDETKRDQTPAGLPYSPGYTPTMSTITQTVSGSPNATLEDGTPALQITLTPPGIPGGATIMSLAGIPYGTSTFGVVRVELVSDPVISPLTGPIIKVAIKNAGWLSSFSADMTAYIVWE